MHVPLDWRASQGSIDPPAGIAPADLGALLRAAQAATDAADLAALVQRLMAVVIEHAAAERGVLLVPHPVEDPAGEMIASLRVEAECSAGGAANVLRLLGVGNVTRRLLVPETGIGLSPREVDVLEMLAANASNCAIAERLEVDIATVKSHVTRVLAKLGVRTRHEAAERARALGLGNGSPKSPAMPRD